MTKQTGSRGPFTAAFWIGVMTSAGFGVAFAGGLYLYLQPDPYWFWIFLAIAALAPGFAFVAGAVQHAVETRRMQKVSVLGGLEAQNELIEKTFNIALRVAGGDDRPSPQSIENALSYSVETLQEELGLDGCSVRILNSASGVLEPLVGCGNPAQDRALVPLELGNGVAGRAAAERRPFFVDDVTREKDFVHGARRSQVIRSMFSTPLLDGEEVVGVLSGSSKSFRNFHGHERQILTLVSKRIGTLIRLYRDLRRAPAES